MSDLKDKVENYFREHGHYGLRRDLEDRAMMAAADFSLSEDQLPPVDLAMLPPNMGVLRWLRIENQLRLSSCVGNSGSSCHEISYYRETKGSVIQVSRFYIYLTAQKKSGITGDNGATITGCCQAGQEFGAALEEFFPYPNGYTSRIPEAALIDGPKRVMRTFKKMRSYDECLRWLYHGLGSIQVGKAWSSACEPDSQGKVESWSSRGGGHALCWSEWDTRFKDSQGQPYLCEVNSWGAGYGLNGVAYLSPKVVEYLCENEDVYGFSDLEGDELKPRSFDWSKLSFFA